MNRPISRHASEHGAASAAQELKIELGTDRVFLSGPGYESSLRIWNGAVQHRPALVVRAATRVHVQAAISAARRNQVPLSVRGGGHDWAGRALRDHGMVIDLSAMRDASVDPDRQIATVAGGTTAADVINAAAPYRLSAATGTVGSVGMASLTLGGGYGPLNGRFGLALDNLLGAEVVLADGRCVSVDATHEPELYWALRGRGGNVGVVTSMRIRLHPVYQLLAGFIVYPWSQASQVLHQLRPIVASAPDELTIQVAILSGSDGSPVLILSPAWSGDLAEGELAVHELERLGTPLASQVTARTYSDMLGLYDAYVVNGRKYAIRTRSVLAYTPDLITALVEAGSTRSSALSVISIHHFHGAAARVPIESTAFGIRRDHFVVEIVAAWQPDDTDDERHIAWAETTSDALAVGALPGGYINLLGPESHEQIALAYGPNSMRLVAAKKRFDPFEAFSATPLPLD